MLLALDVDAHLRDVSARGTQFSMLKARDVHSHLAGGSRNSMPKLVARDVDARIRLQD